MVLAPLSIYLWTSWCFHEGMEASWDTTAGKAYSKLGRPVDPISDRSITGLAEVPDLCPPELRSDKNHYISDSDVIHKSFLIVTKGHVIPTLTLNRVNSNTKLKKAIHWPENDEWRGLEVTWDRVTLSWQIDRTAAARGLRYSASFIPVLSAPSAYRDQATMGMRMDRHSHHGVVDKVSLFYGQPARRMPMDGTVIASDGDFFFHVIFDCAGFGMEVGRPFFHVLLKLQLFDAELGTQFDDIVIPFTKVCDSPASETRINLALVILPVLGVWLHLRTLRHIVCLWLAMVGTVISMQFGVLGFGKIRFTTHFVLGALVLRGGTEVLRSARDLIQVNLVAGLISCVVFVTWLSQERIHGTTALAMYSMGAALSLGFSIEGLCLSYPMLSRHVASATVRHIRQIFDPACLLAIGLLIIVHQQSPELVAIHLHTALGCLLINQGGVGLLCSLAHQAFSAEGAVCIFMRRLYAFAWLLTGGTLVMMAVVMHWTPQGGLTQHWGNDRNHPPTAAEEASTYIAITIFVCAVHLALLLISSPSHDKLQCIDQSLKSLDHIQLGEVVGRAGAPVYMPVDVAEKDC